MENDVPETELSECEIEGADWLLEQAKAFVDNCDAEGLSEPEAILEKLSAFEFLKMVKEAMTALVTELERVIREEKEKLNG